MRSSSPPNRRTSYDTTQDRQTTFARPITMSKTAKGISIAVVSAVVIGSALMFVSRVPSALAPAVASVGGIIVFVGLWIEKKADVEEKKLHRKHLTEEELRIRRNAEIG